MNNNDANAKNTSRTSYAGASVDPDLPEKIEVAESSSIIDDPNANDGHPMVIYAIAVCATIGGLLFGYQTAIINGALLVIAKDFEVTEVWYSAIPTSTIAAAALFSIITGVVADKIGRKPTIMIAATLFTGGGLVMGLAPNLFIIVVGRSILGAGIGIVSAVVPIYVSECAPKDIRGRLITLNQLFITLGIVLSSVSAGLFQDVKRGWRWMVIIAAVPSAIQLVAFFFLPESPSYLIIKGKDQDAESVLRRIRGRENVKREFEEIKEGVGSQKESQGAKVWMAIFKTDHVRKALIIGAMLQVFQQFCGINVVIYYSATILKTAGFSSSLAIWLSTIPFSINFLATFLGLWAVETLGRKRVLAVSFVAIAGACGILTIGFVLALQASPEAITDKSIPKDQCSDFKTCDSCIKGKECGFCVDKHDTSKTGVCLKTLKEEDDDDVKDQTFYSKHGKCSKNSSSVKDLKFMTDFCYNEYAALPLIGLIGFVLAFAPGAGPMPWTINAEIYPIWSRSVANSIATLTNWMCNVIITATFPFLLKFFKPYGTFAFFMVVCILAAAFVMTFVPETKGKSLEEIEYLFMTEEKRIKQQNNQSSQNTKTVCPACDGAKCDDCCKQNSLNGSNLLASENPDQ